MTDAAPDPHTQVEIELNFGSPGYIVTATSLYGDDSGPWWESLGNLLYGRPGWYCELANTSDGPKLMWSFGALGTSLFNIVLRDDLTDFDLFDYEADQSVSFESIEQLGEWLDRNESRHSDHVRRNLTPMASADGWRLLRLYEFVLDVTFDGSAWIAIVQKLPVTAAFGSSLTVAVSNAREAIAHEFQAPKSLATDITVSVRLDPAAVAALTLRD